MGEREADEDKQDEVAGADTRCDEVAQLLADLALDAECGDRGAEQSQPEERRLGREVGAQRVGCRTAVALAADEEDERADDCLGGIDATAGEVAAVDALPLGEVAGRFGGDRPERSAGKAAV